MPDKALKGITRKGLLRPLRALYYKDTSRNPLNSEESITRILDNGLLRVNISRGNFGRSVDKQLGELLNEA